MDLTKGAVHAVYSPEDVAYFRARPDVVAECDVLGNILGAAAPGAVDPKKTKSFRVYGAPQNPNAAKGPPPPVPVMVGKQMVSPNGPPPPPVIPIQHAGVTPPPAAPVVTPVVAQGPAVLPSVPPPPPLDRKARSAKAQAALQQLEVEQRSQPITPIEEVDSSGKTQANVTVRR